MNKHLRLALLLALVASFACSSGDDDTSEDDDSNAGSGSGGSVSGGGTGGPATASGTGGKGNAGKSGGSGGAGKGGDSECVNRGEINFDCPFNLPPLTGSCAPHGECCYRTSNNEKIAALDPDAPAVIEYRLNFVDIINHPRSIGLPDLMTSAAQRADVCAGEQCLLWRFTAPRKGGEFVAGPSEVEIGVGAYNCDGSYSFYGPNAATDRSDVIGEKDPGRWQAVKVAADFDPAKQGIDRYHIPWATNKNREISRSIFIWPADYTIDWELASSGFTITSFDTTEAGQDCQGARDNFKWNAVAGFVSYSPLKGNDKDISQQINQTYCSLLAFGLLPEGKKDKDCNTTERCMPDEGVFGDGGCDWLKLPDSLCPETEEERATFGCHLGAEGNVNAEDGYPATLNCTQEKPTAPLNPDMGATSEGQCCDPLGQSATLPACNNYRTVGKFVAAAAEISDEPIDTLPPKCM